MDRQNRTFTIFRALILIVFVVGLMVVPTASAMEVGQFFRHDDARYWWYQGDDGLYEVAVPASPAYFIEQQMFGETFVQQPLSENGSPFLFIGSFATAPGAGEEATERARQGVTERWRHVLTDTRLIENRTITTSRGLPAHFTALQGTTPTGETGMLRAVFFAQENYGAYLVWVGNTGDYADAHQQAWIEAVNSFAWLR